MDFTKYNLRELDSALQGIDRDKYYQRHQDLTKERQKRQVEVNLAIREFTDVSGWSMDELLENHHKKIDFKDTFGGYIFSFGLIGLLIVLSGVFGANTVSWNGDYVHGLLALALGIPIVLIFTLIFAGITYFWVLFYRYFVGRYSYNKSSKSDAEKRAAS
tara:strand:+ start:28 stop:507 length:480 start_codon:yes stop_codon:yes gene_type:complete